MKIATWNVNGIRARREQLLEWIGSERPDVLCLQEIKASPGQIPEEVCNLGGYWCHWHGAGGYSGVGLSLRRDTFPDEPRFIHPPFDRENRIVAAQAGSMTFASVYVPNGGKDYEAKLDFLNELDAFAATAEAAGDRIVLCGDMNVTRDDRDVHPKERKPNAIGQRPDEREIFERLLGHGLADVARELHPDDHELFTWWAPWRNLRQRNIGWRIDYILASRSIAAAATSCVSLREVGTSDHGPLVAEFDLG
jgi:exodeoxyribonuclease III